MGYFKQLHIDCYEGTCEVNQEETCYMQSDNPSYYKPRETKVININGTNCPFCHNNMKTMAGLSTHLKSKHLNGIATV